jgi:hypothetical protein
MVSPSASAVRPLKTEVSVALIASLSTLAGALIGGGFGYLTNRDLQDRDAARQDRLVAVAARTGAALELHRFESVEQTAGFMASQHQWVALDSEDRRPRLTNEQLAALVGALNLKESDSYQSAEACITEITTLPHTIDTHIAVALNREIGCLRDGDVVMRRLVARSGRS